MLESIQNFLASTGIARLSGNPDFWKPLIMYAIVAVLVIAELVVIIRLIRLKKQERASKAAAKAEKLPDDDSPLEYV